MTCTSTWLQAAPANLPESSLQGRRSTQTDVAGTAGSLRLIQHTGMCQPGAESPTSSCCCRYRKQFEANPADYHRPDKSSGGYWFTQRPPAPARPFTAGTTYQAELLEGGPSAEGQLSRTVGLRSTLGRYEGARR